MENMEVIVNFLFSISIKEKNAERLLFLCHLVYEAHNPELYKALGRSASLENVRLNFPEDINLFDSLVIGKFLSHANIHVKCLDLHGLIVCLTSAASLNLALLTDNISEVIVEELVLNTSPCTINKVKPFFQHFLFSNVASLELQLPTDPADIGTY